MAAADVVIGPATPADLAGVAGIFAHYVTGSLVTFEQTPPAVADWHRRLDDLAGLGLPFLVARAGQEVAGYAYAGPWRRSRCTARSASTTRAGSPASATSTAPGSTRC